MVNKGLVIVVSSPSGGGKGTILKQLMERMPSLRYSVSATTRGPRPGEVDGKHYRFIGREDFEALIAHNDMLEYAEYCGNFYGTPREPVQRLTEEGFDVLLEIEVVGGKQIKAQLPDCVTVFIAPPSMEVLERRLRNRQTEDDATIAKRLETARRVELPTASEYDYIVTNDKLEDAVEAFTAIITAEKLKTSRNIGRIERMITPC